MGSFELDVRLTVHRH